jgi:GT2 family glycosyltransferase
MKDSSAPRISFIVPVRNDAARLERCLQSIRANGLPPERFEIVVADNGSTDDSTAVARRYGALVVVIDDAPVAELRNRAARQATGDILAFVDADNEIASSWGEAAIETLRNRGIGATGAQYREPDSGTWVQRAYGYLRGHPRGIHDVEWLGSGNLAVPLATFEAVGGFNATLETCEDIDLCARIRRRGLRIVSDARLASIHHGDPATLWSLFRGELWRGRDNLRVSFRPPLSWRTIVSALIPVVDLIMIVAALVALAVMTRFRATGLYLLGGSATVVAANAALKVAQVSIRTDTISPGILLQTFVVACVYDLARALAVIARVRHRGARRTAPAIAS